MEMILLQAAGQNGGSPFSSIIMVVAIGLIFWLFMIRPQQKRQKELQKKRDALGTNDRIVTSGGLYGVIKDVKQTEFVVEIADGVRVRVDKGSVFPAGDPEAAAKLPTAYGLINIRGCLLQMCGQPLFISAV